MHYRETLGGIDHSYEVEVDVVAAVAEGGIAAVVRYDGDRGH